MSGDTAAATAVAELAAEPIFVAVGGQAWGCGSTIEQARARRREHGGKGRAAVYRAPEGVTKAWVDELGRIEFNVAAGLDPEEVGRLDWPVHR